MKFAIFSDIHGNLPALNAVIEDAEKQNVDSFLFLGDYCISNPYPDECIARIRSLDRKYAVQGNEEKYLENLIGKDQDTWTDGQMQISYWCFRNISADNLAYLLALPARLRLECNGIPLHMAHSSEEFIGDCEHREWAVAKVAARYQDTYVTRDRFRADIHSYFDNDRQFQDIFSRLENGIYLFGHSHIQWSYQSGDGRKILINPRSCGLPLDCIRDGLPYTILDLPEGGSAAVEERRVDFRKDEYISFLLQSEQFVQAKVWSQIIIEELWTAREHMRFFLGFVEKYATEIGDTRRPFSVPTWEKAFELWKKQGGISDSEDRAPGYGKESD